MYQLASHPQTIWQIMRDSLKLYKAAYLRLLFWAILMGVINWVFTFVDLSLRSQGVTYLNQLDLQNHLHVTEFIRPLTVTLLSLIPFAAIMFDIHQTMHGHKPTIYSAFQRAIRTWPRLVGAMVLYLFMLMILGIIAVMLKIVGAIIAGIVGTYLVISLFAWHALIATEQQGVMQAFKNSFKNIKHHWWHTLGLLAVVVLIIVVINFLIVFIFQGTFLPDPTNTPSRAEVISTGIVTCLFIPWLYGVILLQVHNLELRRQHHHH